MKETKLNTTIHAFLKASAPAAGLAILIVAAALVIAGCRPSPPEKKGEAGNTVSKVTPPATPTPPERPVAPPPPVTPPAAGATAKPPTPAIELPGDLPPVPAKPSRTSPASFVVLYSTGVTGELVDCGCPHNPRGGLARRALWIKKLREAQPAVVYLDGGNTFFANGVQPATVTEDLKNRARVQAKGMAAMGMDVANIGPNDLASGLNFITGELAKGDGKKGVPFVSANLVTAADHKRIFPPYRIVDVGGVQLGVFGLAAPEGVTDPSLVVLDPAAVARQMVEALKGKCDLVVGLYAMNSAAATKLGTEAPGVDIIISSDAGSSPASHPLAIADTLVAQAGNRGMFLGRMDLKVGGGEGKLPAEKLAELKNELSRLAAQRTLLEGKIQQDPVIKAEYDKVVAQQAQVNAQLGEAGKAFSYENSLIALELSLPEDEQVAGWVKAIGVQPRTPAPDAPQPPAPGPAPAPPASH
jgi:2',3'-cyclic-nucleotide 2'-phosphodiesterase (5'-nucleotidase family)